jgi:hypothetical protein
MQMPMRYITLFMLISIASCYDPTENIPIVCFTTSGDTVGVGEAFTLKDCSYCTGITVYWGDSVRSSEDTHTYFQGQSGNHLFRHIYADTGRFIIKVSVYKAIKRGIDCGATFRYGYGYDTVLVK